MFSRSCCRIGGSGQGGGIRLARSWSDRSNRPIVMDSLYGSMSMRFIICTSGSAMNSAAVI